MSRTTLPRYRRTRFAREGNEGGGGGGQGGAGGAGGGQNSGGQSGSGGQGDEFTPITSQEALSALIQDRVRRAEAKGYSDAEAKYKPGHERAAALELELGTEADKAAAKARDEARAEASGHWTPRVVRAEFKAAAKGVLSGDQLGALLEDLDLSKYVTESGDVDGDKIEKKVKAFAPAGGNGGGNGQQQRHIDLGQGNQRQAVAKKGDAGRAEAQRRFGGQQKAAAGS